MRALAENRRQLTANEKNDSSEMNTSNIILHPTRYKREDADQLHLRDAVTSFLL